MAFATNWLENSKLGVDQQRLFTYNLRAAIPGRLMAGRLVLVQVIGVRVPAREP